MKRLFRRPPVVGLAIALSIVVSLTLGGGSSPADVNGKIAFRTSRDDNFEIYSMNADGTGPTNLTRDPGVDADPDWSPDGAKIAFTRHTAVNSDVWVMNADGSGQVDLTNSLHDANEQPAWSPDGTKIAFRTTRDGNFEIYSMNADGTGPTNLTRDPDIDGDPAWSPDGTKIASSRRTAVVSDIWVMNADGSGQVNLTNSSPHVLNDQPTWSPVAPITSTSTSTSSTTSTVPPLTSRPCKAKLLSERVRFNTKIDSLEQRLSASGLRATLVLVESLRAQHNDQFDRAILRCQ